MITGSTALILAHPNYVCIGADSRMVQMDGAGKILKTLKTSKVFVIRDFACCHTGFIKDLYGNFDFRSIVDEATSKGCTLADINERVIESVKISLPKALASLRKNDVAGYENHYLHKENVLSFCFGSMASGVPEIHTSTFNINGVGVEQISIPWGIPSLGVLGEQQEINSYLDRNRPPFNNGIVNGFNFLIGLEARKNPNLVSLPIDLIQLAKGKNTWLARSG